MPGLRFLLGGIVLANAATGGLAVEDRPIEIPKIDVVYPPYGTVFDRTCGDFVKSGGGAPEEIAAAGKLRPDLQAEWDREGPGYLSVVRREIGLPFPYAEMQVVLTVCPVGTMSMPLLVNVRAFLPGRAATERPPAGDFSEKVFHELMHHYVAPVHATSSLRKKYEKESPVVVNHLHVMALEKLALTKLDKTEELRYLERLYRTDPPPAHYRRAWEIVADVEGPEPFLSELKAAARR